MSSKYQQPYAAPQGFAQILKEFTREILRAQPTNLYEFGAQYFKTLAESRPADSADSEAYESLSSALRGTSSMHVAQLRDLLASDKIGLTPYQATYVIGRVGGISDDGSVRTAAFTSAAAPVVDKVKADGLFTDILYNESALIEGRYGPSEVVAAFEQAFANADSSETGRLPRSMLGAALQFVSIPVSEYAQNIVLLEAQEDDQGFVAYGDLVNASHFLLFLAERFQENS
jgi:hypothetical protein